MSLRRVLATTLVSSLVATATALGAGPASAGINETRIVSGGSGPWIYPSGSQNQPGAVVKGGTLGLSIEVETTDGGSVFEGTITVQRRLAGSSSWRTVATSDNAWLYGSTPAVSNATYKVLYDGQGAYGDAEATRSVKVQKKLTITPQSSPKLGLAGKISPQGRNKVVVLKKKGKRWVKYKVVTSNRKGRFFAGLPAPRKRGAKFFWKLKIGASKKYALTKSATYYTVRYRPVARVS